MSLLGAIRLAAITAVLVSASPAEADRPIGDPREQALVAIAAAEKSVTVNPIVALDESKRALALIDRIPVSADRTRLLANAVWLEAQALNRLNRLDEAKNVVTPVLNQIEKIEPGSNIHAELLYTLSSILQKQGDVQESFRTLKRTFSYFEKNMEDGGRA
jgi:tetratricopeptide (TPR) repeat protein